MSCIVRGCSSRSGKKEKLDENTSFHVFPKNYELRQKWLIATDRNEKEFNRYWKVCSRHFDLDSLLGTPNGCGRVYLKGNTVPSLNLTRKTGTDWDYSNTNVSHRQSSTSPSLNFNGCPTTQQMTNYSQRQSSTCISNLRTANIGTGYMNDVNGQQSSTSAPLIFHGCPTTNVSQLQSANRVLRLPIPLSTTYADFVRANQSQSQSCTNVNTEMNNLSATASTKSFLPSTHEKDLTETKALPQSAIAIYQGRIHKLQKRAQELEILAKNRLLKVKSLKQQAIRLKKKNTDINDKLIELLEKEKMDEEYLIDDFEDINY